MKHSPTCALVLTFAAASCGGGTKAPTVPADDLPSDDKIISDDDATPPVVAQGHPKDDLIPRAILYGNPERAGVELSPDGKYVSWVAPRDGLMNVWVAPAGDLTKATAVTNDKVRPIWQYFWTFDGKHLLYSQDTNGDENFHLFRVDVETGETTDLVPIAGARVQMSGMSERKPGQIVVGVNDRDPGVFDLWTIDLATGAKTLLVQNDQGFLGYTLDHDLKVRMAMRTTESGGAETFLYEPKNKKNPWKPFDKVELEDVMTTGVIGFDKKGTSFYSQDSRGRDTSALYVTSVKTKKKKLLVEDDRTDVGDIFFSPVDHTPLAVSVTYDKPRWIILDKKVQKDFDALAKVDDGHPMITSTTKDNKSWIVAFDSDRHSPRYYRWDRTTQQSEFLFALQPALDEQPLAPMHPVIIATRDGLELVSYLTLPNDADEDRDGQADRPVPMVMFIHGGPWARDQWGYNPVHQQFANRGYAVLSVNYRGSTGFGKKFLAAGDLQWGKKMHDDLLDAVEWAVTSNTSPRDKICISGASYGGYATLVGVAMTPDVFACGVDLVGPSDLVTFQETIPPYWGPWIPILHARIGNPTTEEGKAMLREASPLTHAGDIKVPLLIGQGKNDPRVNERESAQIVEAMQAKKIPVSYLLFPDEGHGFALPANDIAFWAITEAFLSVHLGGYYQPITEAELAASSMQVVAGREWLPGLPADEAKKVSSR